MYARLGIPPAVLTAHVNGDRIKAAWRMAVGKLPGTALETARSPAHARVAHGTARDMAV